jgi:cell wall-associated NlpC family hydrolase
VRYRPGFISNRTASAGAPGSDQRDRGALTIEFVALTVFAVLMIAAVVAAPGVKSLGTYTTTAVNKILDTDDHVNEVGGLGNLDIAGAPTAAAKIALAYALQQYNLKKMYQYGAPGFNAGAPDPSTYDCSSLVQWAYGKAGITLPRVSHDQFMASPRVQDTDFSNLKPGDLLFFNTHDGDPPPSHVGMYLGGGKMVNAWQTGFPIRIETLGSERRSEYMGATRPSSGKQ